METGTLVDFLLSLLIDILACAEIILFLNKLLLMRIDRRIHRWIIAAGIVAGSNLFSFFGNGSELYEIMRIIVGSGAVILCVEGKLKDKSIRSLFALFSISGFEIVTYCIYSMFKKGLNIPLINELLVNEIYVSLISELIIILLIIIIGIAIGNISNYSRWIMSVKNSVYILMTVYMVVMSAVDSLLKKIISRVDGEIEFVVVVVLSFAIVSTYGICIGMAKIDYNRQCYEKDSILKDHYLDASKEYFSQLKQQIDEMRRFKHDVTAHYWALDAYLKNSDCESASEYLKTIRNHQLAAYSSYFTTGNELVDAVIYGIISRFENMTIKVDGSIGNVNIKEYDLCTIFYNLVQNAAEAICELDDVDKVINVEIRHYDNKMFIDISNVCYKKIELDNMGKFTTKKDTYLHGYGISNVQRTVEQYDGGIDFKYKNKKFYALVTINNCHND